MLRHLQADRIPFDNPTYYNFTTKSRVPKYNFSLDDVHFGNADKVAWSEISHVNYNGVHNNLPKADFRLMLTMYKKNRHHALLVYYYIQNNILIRHARVRLKLYATTLS